MPPPPAFVWLIFQMEFQPPVVLTREDWNAMTRHGHVRKIDKTASAGLQLERRQGRVISSSLGL